MTFSFIFSKTELSQKSGQGEDIVSTDFDLHFRQLLQVYSLNVINKNKGFSGLPVGSN